MKSEIMSWVRCIVLAVLLAIFVSEFLIVIQEFRAVLWKIQL